MGGYVTVLACPFFEAHLIKGALEVEGLEVRIDRDGLGVVYGLDIGPMSTRLSVPAAQADQARALIAELRADDDG